MPKTREAIYEQGVLRPVGQPFDLKEGQRVRLTVEPISELSPPGLARQEADFLEQMKVQGRVLTLPPPQEPAPADWKPLVLSGEPLSETILKMRGEQR